MQTVNIGKGRLLCVNTDKFKTELLTVTQASPFEHRDMGLCSLLCNVLKRGCREYPTTADINRRLDDLYDANITMGCSTNGDSFLSGVTVETLCRDFIHDGTDVLSGALDVVSRLMTEPLTDEKGLFRAEYVEGEKQARLDRFRSANSNPKTRSALICQDLMFEGERYGQRIFYHEDEIKNVKNSDIADYYKKSLSVSSPLYIYVGPRSQAEVGELINEKLSFFDGDGDPVCDTLIKPCCGEMKTGFDSMAVNQGKLTLGLRSDISIGNDDVYAALVFNDIFGGSPASKLFRNVREKLSLCYSCGSSYDFTKGVIFVRSGIANENYDRALSEILHQLEDIKKGKISEFEFESAKKALVSSYRQVTDSSYATESFFRTRILCGCTDGIEETARKIEQVTLSDVVEAARRFGAEAVGFVRGELDGEEVDFDEE